MLNSEVDWLLTPREARTALQDLEFMSTVYGNGYVVYVVIVL